MDVEAIPSKIKCQPLHSSLDQKQTGHSGTGNTNPNSRILYNSKRTPTTNLQCSSALFY